MFRLFVLRLLALSFFLGLPLSATAWPAAAQTAHKKKHSAAASKSTSTSKSKSKKRKPSRRTVRHLTPAQRARAARIKRAFVASSQLRPMAQQLLENRTPQAYAAVEQ